MSFILLALLLTLSTSFAFPDPRIVNGTFVKPGEIPFIVSLRQHGYHGCSGIIIDKDFVLTAAHCIDGRHAKDMSIMAGSINLTIPIDSNAGTPIANMQKHEEYKLVYGFYHDIALLKLSEPLVFNENVKAVVLPPKDWFTAAGMNVVVAGWGHEKTNGTVQPLLMKTNLKTISDYDCTQEYGKVIDEFCHQCAGGIPGKADCKGDSGGPLFLEDHPILIGIVSWSHKPCGKHTAIYTKVVSYLDWIEKTKELLNEQ